MPPSESPEPNNSNHNTDINDGSDNGPNTPDLSWHSAKTFWIILIIAAIIFLLHIIYKIDKNKRYKMHAASEIGLLRVVTSPQETMDHVRVMDPRFGREDGLQRPRRAVLRTRRGSCESDVSDLPRYERFEEGEVCDEDVKVERRGRYSYVLGEKWPEERSRE